MAPLGLNDLPAPPGLDAFGPEVKLLGLLLWEIAFDDDARGGGGGVDFISVGLGGAAVKLPARPQARELAQFFALALDSWR